MLTIQVDNRIGGCPRYYLGDGSSLMQIPDQIRNTVVFLGYQKDADPVMGGTGFLVSKKVSSDLCLVYLVTAKHVIHGIKDRTENGRMLIRLNNKTHGVLTVETEISKWRFHPNDESIDVAALPISIDGKHWDVGWWPIESFATSQIINEKKIGIGEDVISVGLFKFHQGEKRNIPIVRVGNIAAMPEEKISIKGLGDIDAYLIESRSIRGLSGSPVFVSMGGTRLLFGPPNSGDVPNVILHTTFGKFFYLLGLISAHYDMKNSDFDAVILDAEGESINTGIAIVTPAQKILEVICHPDFVESEKKALEALKLSRAASPDFITPDKI